MFSRILKNLAFVTLPSLLFCVVFFELFFRYVLPACESPYYYFDIDDRILRYDIHGRKEGIFTIGKWAQQRARWRINNHGWNSEIDYASRDHKNKPLIAIIGDSYVEGFQANVEDNLASVLRTLVNRNYEVYGFGISGAPLSQYLLMSRYVKRHFQPEVMVFNVVHNDFRESIRDLVNKPYFLQLSVKKDGFFEAPPVPYEPNMIRRILGKSALVRYLWLNLNISYFPLNLNAVTRKQSTDSFNANIDVREALDDKELIKNASFFLIKKIKEENPDIELVFMIDAPRENIYSGTINNSNLQWLPNILEDACVQNKCHFIDLTKPFFEKYNADHVKFNSEYDWHWNETGHKTAAQVLYHRLIEKQHHF
jgi:hypothetical protein